MLKRSKNVFFSPPFIYTGMSAVYNSIITVMLLTAQLIFIGFAHDFAAIAGIMAATGATVAASLFIGYIEQSIQFDIDAVLIGMLTGFSLPATLGVVSIFCISFFAYSITWGMFGGKGKTWIHPAMLAVCIAFICCPQLFASCAPAEMLQRNGSALALLDKDFFAYQELNQYITTMLNSKILHTFGVTLPEGYTGAFISFPSCIPALRYNGIILISSIVLLSVRIIYKVLPFTFLITYGVLIALFPAGFFTAGFGSGDILSAILTNGVLFVAFFILPDCGSQPRSWGGKIASGVLTGVLSFLIAGPGITTAGIAFAVLSSNCFTPFTEILENRYYALKRKHYV